LDKQRRPTFRYSFGELEVEDYYKEVPGDDEVDASLDRQVTFKGSFPDGLYFRAAVGKSLESLGENSFRVGELIVRFSQFDGLETSVRSSGGELLVPIKPVAGQFVLRQRLEW